mgnify:CR=1 FL=1
MRIINFRKIQQKAVMQKIINTLFSSEVTFPKLRYSFFNSSKVLFVPLRLLGKIICVKRYQPAINMMNDIVLSSPNDGNASAFEIDEDTTGLRINFNGFSIAFPTKDQGNGRIFKVESGAEVTFSDLNVANGTVFSSSSAVGAARVDQKIQQFYFSC